MDYEVARIFRNHLIPNAVLWFTGEAVSEDDDEVEDDEEEEEEEEEVRCHGCGVCSLSCMSVVVV